MIRKPGSIARPHLEGWKEIAGYFGRTVRTVQRWERDQALPVRRHHHADLSSVYADPHELDAWRARQAPSPEASPATALIGAETGDAAVLHAMAMDHWKQRTKDGFQKCIALCHTALARNPEYAPAYAMLAVAHQTRATYGLRPPLEDIRLAREYVSRALALDAASVLALQALAMIRIFDFDWPVVSHTFESALALDPNDASVMQHYSLWFIAMKREREACEMAARAERLNSWLHLSVNLAWMLHFAGRFEEAAHKAESVIRRNRHAWRGYFNLGLSLTALGRFREAASTLEVASALDDNQPAAIAACAAAYALGGDRARAEKLLATLRQTATWISPYWQAHTVTALGSHDEALRLLRRSRRDHEWFLMFMNHEPAFLPLRSHPGFIAIAKEIGLP